MEHKLDVPDLKAAGKNDAKANLGEVKVKIEVPDDPLECVVVTQAGDWCQQTGSNLLDGSKFTNPILNADSDADKRRYRRLIDEMKYLRWWDDIEESYAIFESQFCEEIEYNIKSLRSKHFPMTKLIRHYEIDTAISAFVQNGAATKRAIGVYIGYTSPGPFSRMFDETVTSPERKNRNGNFVTVRRFILNLQSVPSESRASFTEKALVRQYSLTYEKTVINCEQAATIDRQDGWVYLTFHKRLDVVADSADAGVAAYATKASPQTNPTRTAFAPDPALYAPEVERAFTRTGDSYRCNFCKEKTYKAKKDGTISNWARKHYVSCNVRKSTSSS